LSGNSIFGLGAFQPSGDNADGAFAGILSPVDGGAAVDHLCGAFHWCFFHFFPTLNSVISYSVKLPRASYFSIAAQYGLWYFQNIAKGECHVTIITNNNCSQANKKGNTA
jgi:hypothetical protein